jgi:hypothetical protein
MAEEPKRKRTRPPRIIPFVARSFSSVREITLEERIIGRSKLYELIADGRVKTVKVDGKTLVVVPSLLAVMGLSAPAGK